jgi:hypothetical protein
VEAAQRFLEARERHPVGSKVWAQVTAAAFDMLRLNSCAEVAKPEWWNDKGLKALSARVVRTAPDSVPAHQMRAMVLSMRCCASAWEAEPRSAAEFREAAAHFEQGAALCPAPAMKELFNSDAAWCRRTVEAM